MDLVGKKVFGLFKGVDPSKDQSYFLWTLNQEQLSKILFPIGDLKKAEVRKLAKKFKLPVAEKKDSQGICFLGPVDLKEFLAHYIDGRKGDVVNEKGEVIGHHRGALFYTLGERHGFTITKKTPNDERYYIVSKDIEKNILVVSHNQNILSKSNLSGTAVPANFSRRRAAKDFSQEYSVIPLENINWIIGELKENKSYTAQIRYHGAIYDCRVKNNKIVFTKPPLVASGQSIVVYDKDVCLGGGVVV